MTAMRLIAGGAVVPGWTVRSARSQAAMRAKRAREIKPERNVQETILAPDLIEGGAWPVRNQGHRATCNAFAVVAAEELSSHLTGGLKRFSEEQLYNEMRRTKLPSVVAVDLKPEIDATGTTFLEQAKAVMATGLHPRDGDDYELRPSLKPNHTTGRQPRRTKVPVAANYLHDIVKDRDIAGGLDWFADTVIGVGALAWLFLDKLEQGIPVVASFALLQGTGIASFSGPNGRFLGEVRYPPHAVAVQRKAVAGHTVCILGYVPAVGSTDLLDGRFLFRNSFGTVRCGSLAGRDPDPRLPPARGYGHIRGHDLETYCWEYLCRA